MTSTGKLVLVADDERIVREVVADYLARDGFQVVQAADGLAARDVILSRRPHVAIIDVMMPGLDGFELCRIVRERAASMPLILLTARGEESDRVVGLELGADDYVVKPFSPRELAARVRAVLRRAENGGAPATDTTLVFGHLTIARASREVTYDRDPVSLTAREFDLLLFLARHPRHVFTRDQLMERVWGHVSARDTGTVTVHVRRLREKLEHAGCAAEMVETIWGVGYRFRPDAVAK